MGSPLSLSVSPYVTALGLYSIHDKVRVARLWLCADPRPVPPGE